MTKIFDAFISYGRADSKDFATKLQAHLNEQGLKVWFDFNNIPLGVDFQNQIDDGIEKANHFLFIISPHSVNSPYCLKEIELAIKCHKRIIPLLHVEQISKETWLSRNPNGTDEEWEVYQSQGKHTCFQNMHPTIGKINWVYFREDKDDFEQSFAGLIELLQVHHDYVEQHTKFLIKALEWERNQKETRYLLTGEEKKQAEAWLKIRFEDEQAPCVPSDLHCEYITESIKNANNLMTEVFLSYADEDREIMKRVRNSLRRESITVWTNTTDIQTGEDFGEAINRGIEQADNIVYLLSPESINSTYCQQELELAASLNKRIIPLLVGNIESIELPSQLQGLQYIDLTDNLKQEDYFVDESQLLRILHQDAAYYKEHKILLTKALKWKQQQNNPSILLRGYNLRSADTWLKVARKRTQHPPIPLQEEFINESLRQPPLESLDVFISYSRADSDFARKLNDALQIQGKTTWFDQESIASGSNFQEEIYRGIKASDNFLFILSPRSINSPYCKDEVEYAASLNKRFINLLHRKIETSELHPELAQVQWIDFNRSQGDFDSNFNQLLRTIDTDRDHVHSHSKWSQRALEWEEKDKTDDLLLRGNEFLLAQNWLEETEQQKKKPTATALQKAFIQASQKAIEIEEAEEKRRQAEMLRLQEEKTKQAEARLEQEKKNARLQKFFLIAVSIGLVAAVGLAAWAIRQRKIADEAREGQLHSVSRFSLQLSEVNRNFDALLEAISAGSQLQDIGKSANPKLRSEILTALQQAVYGEWFREQDRLTSHKGTVFDGAWSPDGKKIATVGGDRTLKLWNLNGEEIKNIQVGNDDNEIYSASFNPDGKLIAIGSNDKTLRIWDSELEELVTIGKHQDLVSGVTWSPDGNIIASASEDKTVKLWDRQGKLLKTLRGHQKGLRSVNFSPNGEIIASASEDGTIKLWNVNNGRVIQTIAGDKGNSKIYSVNFSPDGKSIVFASNGRDNSVKLFNLGERQPKTIAKHKSLIWSVVWSPDGKTIASASDRNVKLWNKQGKLLETLLGHNGSVKSVKFSPDGETIATTSEDNTAKLWSRWGKKLRKLRGDREAEVWSVVWNPEGNQIVSGRAENTIKLWTNQGVFIPTNMKHQDAVSSLSFHPDGEIIASGSGDNTIKLWSNEGKELIELQGHNKPVWSVAWSPDGNNIVSGSGDNTIKLWSKEGKFIRNIGKHDARVWSVAWSPDGNNIASGSGDNTIKLWSKSGNFIGTIGEHEASVVSVAWSPHGDYIVSGSRDNTIKLWSKEGKEIKTFKGHNNDVISIAFSPDGEKLASVSKDLTVRLWNKEGEELQILNGHKARVTSVAWSPDGKTLATASDDKTVILWNLADFELDKLMQDACAQLKDYFESNPTDRRKNFCKGK